MNSQIFLKGATAGYDSGGAFNHTTSTPTNHDEAQHGYRIHTAAPAAT